MNFNEYRLRNMEAKDLDLVLKWRNSDHIRSVSTDSRLIEPKEHKIWFQRKHKSTEDWALIFEGAAPNVPLKPLGVVSFDYFHKSNGYSWNIYLGDGPSKHGVGTIMGLMAIQFAFGFLNTKRIIANVISNNTRSLNFHESLGFKKINRIHDYVIRDGKELDLIIMVKEKK